MRSKFKSLFRIISLLGIFLSFQGFDARASTAGLDLDSMRLSGMLFYNSTGLLGTGMIAWTPKIASSVFRIQLSAGIAPMRRQTPPFYYAVEYTGGLGVCPFGGIWLEGFGGMQYWSDFGTHAPVAGGNLIFSPNKKFLGFIDEVFIGYAALLPPGIYTHEARAGLGLNF